MDTIEIKNLKFETGDARLALIEELVPAGFPSPAQGMRGDTIDLNRELIHNPSATFCAKVMGDSMVGYGIGDGDLLIIDKSLQPREGSIAVCFIDGDFTVKRLSIRADGIYLVPGNPSYPCTRIPEDNNFQVWGIVSHIIKNVSASH